MTPWISLALAASAAEPAIRTIAVTYTMRVDLGQMADLACPTTGICDCSVTWTGTGDLAQASGERLTFHGTWKVSAGACNEAVMLWTPADGEAYHTVRLSPDRGTVTEWIAHDRVQDVDRFTTNIKARGQVWLADLAAAIDPATHTATHYERANGDAGPISVATEHTWTVVLGP